MEVVGIDVGSRRLDAVALDGEGRVLGTVVFPAADVEGLVAWVTGAAAVAVDAPDTWSTAPHAGDEGLAPKFRSARCAEIGLGRMEGIWVPWTTPVEGTPGTWIAVGVRLFAALRDAGHHPLEVFPHATFPGPGERPATAEEADGRRRPGPGDAAAGGRRVRAGDGLVGPRRPGRRIGGLRRPPAHGGTARPVTCGHDGSAIWLPRSGPGDTT
jgi:predicted nuclease with RNAse H fold